tara:strand:+ start:40 stop:783 length:744 start_codon:yes stop_codon:yes gene_type:complete
MVAPLVAAGYIFVQLGRGAKAIHKIANTPAGRERLKEFMSKGNPYGIKQVKPGDIPKRFQDGKKLPDTLTRDVLKQKDPGFATKVANIFSKKGNRVTKKTAGVDKPGTGVEPVGKLRTPQKNKGRNIIAGTVVGVPVAAAGIGGVAYVSSKGRKKTRDLQKKLSRAELERDIEKSVSKYERERKKSKPSAGAKDKGKTTSLSSVSVKKGDTLIALSKKHGVSLEKLKQLNPKVKPRQMQIGSRIKLK